MKFSNDDGRNNSSKVIYHFYCSITFPPPLIDSSILHCASSNCLFSISFPLESEIVIQAKLLLNFLSNLLRFSSVFLILIFVFLRNWSSKIVVIFDNLACLKTSLERILSAILQMNAFHLLWVVSKNHRFSEKKQTIRKQLIKNNFY